MYTTTYAMINDPEIQRAFDGSRHERGSAPPSIPDSPSSRQDIDTQSGQIINSSDRTSHRIEKDSLRFRKSSFKHISQVLLAIHQL